MRLRASAETQAAGRVAQVQGETEVHHVGAVVLELRAETDAGGDVGLILGAALAEVIGIVEVTDAPVEFVAGLTFETETAIAARDESVR